MPPCFALDYFGDIEDNRLIIKLEVLDVNRQDVVQKDFPQYLVLDKGKVFLTKDFQWLEGDESGIQIGKLNIVGLATPHQSTEFGEGRYLEFIFPKGGWSSDHYEQVIRIPYTINNDDDKGMLQILDKATMEIRWHDPKNESVTVISYWAGTGMPVELKCTVMQNTLGFMNKTPEFKNEPIYNQLTTANPNWKSESNESYKNKKINETKININAIKPALMVYKMDVGELPTSKQGLESLIEKPAIDPVSSRWNGPYISISAIKDPWGNNYKYICPGLHSKEGYDLISYGPDGIESEDDINNWDSDN